MIEREQTNITQRYFQNIQRTSITDLGQSLLPYLDDIAISLIRYFCGSLELFGNGMDLLVFIWIDCV